MTARTSEVGDFLRARRDALQPEDVGLARDPGRRVPGLRREEVAQLADISPEYYLRLEQGRDHQPSEQVLSALSRALQLDAAGAQYLYRLAHPFRRGGSLPAPRHDPAREAQLDAELVAVVAGFGNPALVADRNKDVVAVNGLAEAMAPQRHRPGRNLVLDCFDPRVKAGTQDWERHARRTVAALRLHADPTDPRLQEVVGELSLRDDDFHRWWSRHETAAATHGEVPVLVADHGVVRLHWRDLELPGLPGYVVTMFSAVDEAGARALEVVRARAGRSRGRYGAAAPAQHRAEVLLHRS